MRDIDWNKVPEEPWTVLLTSEEISENSKIYIADFRDTHALFHGKSQKFVGLNKNGHMKLGVMPISLIDGIWYLKEDQDSKFSDIPALELILKRIE